MKPRGQGCPREWKPPRSRDRFKRLRAAIDNVVNTVDGVGIGHPGSCRCGICHLKHEAEVLKPEKCWCAKWQKPGSHLKHVTRKSCVICADPKRRHRRHSHFVYRVGDHEIVVNR